MIAMTSLLLLHGSYKPNEKELHRCMWLFGGKNVTIASSNIVLASSSTLRSDRLYLKRVYKKVLKTRPDLPPKAKQVEIRRTSSTK